MKKIGIHVCRGRFLESEVEQIKLFDGKYTTGYKVVRFDIWSSDISSSSNDCAAMLSTDDLGAMPSSGNMMDAANNEQIAWASVQAGTAGFGPMESIIDPDNMVVQDLFLSGQHAGSSKDINYLIVMEKYEFPNWHGAALMVKNKSQAI
tara:strand:- start:588 stop:1034 length:447 start_codon:yes stop_codon:yes gene_type:complete